MSDQRASPKIPFAVGHGYDIHRLQSGGILMLGGVAVSNQLSPIAHSDGDVVLHAVVDAMMGAMGWGDIGEVFGNDDPRWKGVNSRVFVDQTMQRLRESGYRIINADITIMAERPRLSPHKPKMRELISAMLDGARVNIKAGTNEDCDAVGKGEAVAAHVVVLIAPVD
jgi:2-C-methyl-D-erythritol 2,4-cyclodiphosphate synthase